MDAKNVIPFSNSAFNIIFGEYSTILGLKINNDTFTIDVIKSDNNIFIMGSEYNYNDIYQNSMANIHPNDVPTFNVLFNIENLMNCIKTNQKISTTLMFKDKENIYVRYCMETFISEATEYNMVITSRYSGNRVDLLSDSIRILYRDFYKILKVNLVTDTCEDIKVFNGERTERFTKWCEDFVKYGNIYYEDKDNFNKFIKRINDEKFENYNSPKKTFRYRRKVDNGMFRWVALSVFPCKDYDVEKNRLKVMVYVRDIQDDYTYQLTEQRKMHYLSTHDSITGWRNRFAYENDISFDNFEKDTLIVLKLKERDLGYNDSLILKIRDIVTDFLGVDSPSYYRIDLDEFYILVSCGKEEQDKEVLNCMITQMREKLDSYLFINYAHFSDSSELDKVINEIYSE